MWAFGRVQHCITTIRRQRMMNASTHCNSSSSRVPLLIGDVDHFNGVTIDLTNFLDTSNNVLQPHQFNVVLAESLMVWKNENRSCAWLKVPIELSHLIPPAAAHGFRLHHAQDNYSMLNKWLQEEPSRVPLYATHQLGVSGFVLNEDTHEVLMVQDKHRISKWKFPGGYANLGEDISETAVREVLEETSIKSEFQSILAFRQQHFLPFAFGRSDFYVVCRLKPLNFGIKVCKSELLDAKWMKVSDVLVSADHTLLTKRVAMLVQQGLLGGFQSIDIRMDELDSVFKGFKYKLFHR